MGINPAAIRKAVSSAFRAVDGLAESVVYRRTTTTFVPATGKTTKTFQDFPLRVIFTSYAALEIDRVVITVNDIKAIFQTKDLPITPNGTTDTILRDSGKIHNIVSVKSDPAGATWTLQTRAV